MTDHVLKVLGYTITYILLLYYQRAMNCVFVSFSGVQLRRISSTSVLCFDPVSRALPERDISSFCNCWKLAPSHISELRILFFLLISGHVLTQSNRSWTSSFASYDFLFCCTLCRISFW